MAPLCWAKSFAILRTSSVNVLYFSKQKVVNSDFMSWNAELQHFNKNRQLLEPILNTKFRILF